MSQDSRARLVEKLRTLRRRLRGLYFLSGLGTTLVYGSLALLALYGLDRFLHLPASIRIGHSVLFGAVGVLIVYRKILFPITRRVSETDLALAIERRFPELRDRLVSSIELPQGSSQAPELLGDLYRSAEEGLAHLPLTQVFDRSRPAKSLGLAAVCLSIAGGVFLADPEAAGIWLRRALGESVPWPRQTFLEIQISQSQGALRVERDGSLIRVELARGSDLPVRVLANGTVPDSVTLHVEGAKSRSMLRTGEREFHHAFAAVREPLRFWVTGGDDDDEDPRVEVIPDQPPELAKISVRIEYPSYTLLPPLTREGGSVEALTGSRVRVSVEASRGVAKGVLRFQGSGEEIPLQIAPDSTNPALFAEFEVKSSDRYGVELLSERQIRSADRGSYPVIAVPDRKPEIRVHAPSRADFDATPRARLPLRAEVADDFGVSAVTLLAKAGKDGEMQENPLLVPPDPVRAPESANSARRKEWIERGIEIQEFRVGDRPPHEGEAVLLRLRAADNRAPEANRVESNEIRVLLVSQEEIERRIQENLGRVKESIEAAEILQRERLERVQDLLAVLETEGKLPDSEQSGLRNASVGQSRVLSSARSIAVQTLECFELALYNRFHRDADAWIARYEEGRRTSRAASIARETEPASSADALAAESRGGLAEVRKNLAEGRLGAAEPLGKISEMAELAAMLAEDHARLAVAALEDAGLARDASGQKQALSSARERQKSCLASMEKLLTMLAEWDNYQTVISLAKELLERQRSIQSRTREWMRQNK